MSIEASRAELPSVTNRPGLSSTKNRQIKFKLRRRLGWTTSLSHHLIGSNGQNYPGFRFQKIRMHLTKTIDQEAKNKYKNW